MSISEIIRIFVLKKRTDKKLTYNELAEKAGVSARAIQYWEQGKRNPQDIETVEKVLNALGYRLGIEVLNE